MSDNFLKVYNGLALNPRSSDPANPAEGDVQFSDGTARPKGLWIYYNGNWRQTGGGNGDGFNYIGDADAETGTGDWTVYANTTAGNTIGSVPAPDDFGGTPSGNLTWTANATLPLIEDADFNLSKAASNVQGEGVYYEFNNEKAHRGLKMLFRVFADLSEFDDNDISIWLLSSSDSFTTIDTYISANNPEVLAQKIIAKQFQFDGDSDKSYRLCIHYGSTDTDAKDAYFDGFFFGPKDVAFGPMITDWVDFTPTGSWTTNTTYEGKYRRIGDSAEIKYRVALSGAPNASVLFVDMPPGLSADSTKILTSESDRSVLGVGSINNEGIFNFHSTIRFDISNAQFLVSFLSEDGNGYSQLSSVTNTLPFTFGNTDDIEFTVKVPIAGWQSEAISSEDLGGRAIIVMARGNDGSTIPADDPIPFDQTIEDDTTASWDGTTFTAPESGWYDVFGSIYANTSGAAVIRAYVNGSTYLNIGQTEYDAIGSVRRNFCGAVKLNKGDELQITSATELNLSTSDLSSWIFISKRSSPQTVLETETVAFRATCDTGQSISSQQTIIYNNVPGDTHGAYNPSTGEYTAPVSGWYDIDAKLSMDELVNSDERLIIRLKVDGIELAQNVKEFESTGTYLNTVYIATKIYLNKGEVVTITGQGSGGDNLVANDLFNSFAISRIK